MLNRVVLVGRLVKDPELRYTPNGIAVVSMTLAVNRPFSGADGKREADFINIVVWRKQAENAANYLRKGSLTGIDGRLQSRSYDNSEGKKVFITEVVADSVQFLEPKGTTNGNAASGSIPSKETQPSKDQLPSNDNDPFASDGKPIDISDDDLPF